LGRGGIIFGCDNEGGCTENKVRGNLGPPSGSEYFRLGGGAGSGTESLKDNLSAGRVFLFYFDLEFELGISRFGNGGKGDGIGSSLHRQVSAVRHRHGGGAVLECGFGQTGSFGCGANSDNGGRGVGGGVCEGKLQGLGWAQQLVAEKHDFESWANLGVRFDTCVSGCQLNLCEVNNLSRGCGDRDQNVCSSGAASSISWGDGNGCGDGGSSDLFAVAGSGLCSGNYPASVALVTDKGTGGVSVTHVTFVTGGGAGTACTVGRTLVAREATKFGSVCFFEEAHIAHHAGSTVLIFGGVCVTSKAIASETKVGTSSGSTSSDTLTSTSGTLGSRAGAADVALPKRKRNVQTDVSFGNIVTGHASGASGGLVVVVTAFITGGNGVASGNTAL
jgi:hypothetical protein